MSVYLVLDLPVLKAELRCATTTSGGLCAIICGTSMKQLLCADSWVIMVCIMCACKHTGVGFNINCSPCKAHQFPIQMHTSAKVEEVFYSLA